MIGNFCELRANIWSGNGGRPTPLTQVVLAHFFLVQRQGLFPTCPQHRGVEEKFHAVCEVPLGQRHREIVVLGQFRARGHRKHLVVNNGSGSPPSKTSSMCVIAPFYEIRQRGADRAATPLICGQLWSSTPRSSPNMSARADEVSQVHHSGHNRGALNFQMRRVSLYAHSHRGGTYTTRKNPSAWTKTFLISKLQIFHFPKARGDISCKCDDLPLTRPTTSTVPPLRSGP